MNMKWNRSLLLLLITIILSASAIMANPKSQDDVWERVDASALRAGIASRIA